MFHLSFELSRPGLYSYIYSLMPSTILFQRRLRNSSMVRGSIIVMITAVSSNYMYDICTLGVRAQRRQDT